MREHSETLKAFLLERRGVTLMEHISMAGCVLKPTLIVTEMLRHFQNLITYFIPLLRAGGFQAMCVLVKYSCFASSVIRLPRSPAETGRSHVQMLMNVSWILSLLWG